MRRIVRPYKLASRDRPMDTIVDAGGQLIGGREFVVIAGPCSVESREHLIHTAKSVASSGATLLLCGALKPRTSPYAFQGLGIDGLNLLEEGRRHSCSGVGVGSRSSEMSLFWAACDRVSEFKMVARVGSAVLVPRLIRATPLGCKSTLAPMG